MMISADTVYKTAEGIKPFAIKDCALVALATGRKASRIDEFKSHLVAVDTAVIYHHFWGGLLHASFEEREYNNDFAGWIRHGLHDASLAERLAVLNPTEHADLDHLRQEIIDLIESHLDECPHLTWIPATLQFEFIRSQIVVFDTAQQLNHPTELADNIPHLSINSIFYHFIDARRRTQDSRDDFSDWLAAYGDEFSELQDRLANLDPYFGGLVALRQNLVELFQTYFSHHRN